MLYELRLNPWNLILSTSIVLGLAFACLLFFANRKNKQANRFLGLALFIMATWIFWVVNVDIRLEVYFPRINWIPFTFSLGLGPSLYFYVKKLYLRALPLIRTPTVYKSDTLNRTRYVS